MPCKCIHCQEDCSHPIESIEESKMSYGVQFRCMECSKVLDLSEVIKNYDPTPCCLGIGGHEFRCPYYGSKIK